MRRSDGRRVRARAGTGLVVLASSLGAGCTQLDNFLASIPLFGMMREAPSMDPYEAPRPAPENSVPYASPAGEVPAPMPATEAALNAFGAATRNPVPGSPETLARGKLMYERHCQVCHGPQGAGNGAIIGAGKFPFASNLTLPATVARTDGYLYGIIRVGRGLMPAYGSRIAHVDRWHIVHYLRELQGRGPGPVAGGQGQGQGKGTGAGRGQAAAQGRQ